MTNPIKKYFQHLTTAIFSVAMVAGLGANLFYLGQWLKPNLRFMAENLDADYSTKMLAKWPHEYEYFQFVCEQIPEDAVVGVPPRRWYNRFVRRLIHTPYMLYPRQARSMNSVPWRRPRDLTHSLYIANPSSNSTWPPGVGDRTIHFMPRRFTVFVDQLEIGDANSGWEIIEDFEDSSGAPLLKPVTNDSARIVHGHEISTQEARSGRHSELIDVEYESTEGDRWGMEVNYPLSPESPGAALYIQANQVEGVRMFAIVQFENGSEQAFFSQPNGKPYPINRNYRAPYYYQQFLWERLEIPDLQSRAARFAGRQRWPRENLTLKTMGIEIIYPRAKRWGVVEIR